MQNLVEREGYEEGLLVADDGVRLTARCWRPISTFSSSQHAAAGSQAAAGAKRAAGGHMEVEPRAAIGIVHGLGEHSGLYEEFALFLAAQGLAVMAYDQRGHGRTGGGMPSFETLRRDVGLLVRELPRLGSQKLFLLGHSLGGSLVLNTILRERPALAGAVVLSPLLQTAQDPPRWKLALARLLSRRWPSFSLGTGVSPWDLSHDSAFVRQYLADPLVHRRISATLGWSMLEEGLWSLAHAAELEVPTLLMHGTEDRVTSIQASRAFAAGAGNRCELRCWEGMYHDLHFESDRRAVWEAMLGWIRDR